MTPAPTTANRWRNAPRLNAGADGVSIGGMNLSLLFWVLYIVALLFSAYQNRANFPGWAGGTLIWFLLIGILGYAVFGAMVKH